LSIKLGEKALRARGFEFNASQNGIETLEALRIAVFESTINPTLPPHAQGSVALFVAGLCCITFARGIVERTVLRIERFDAPRDKLGEEETLRITRMSLLPSSDSLGTVAVFKRSDVRGAESHKVTTMFRVRQQGWIGSEIDQYLFPVEGEGGRVGAKGAWVSQDVKYLQKLIYSDYFRPTEKSPVFDRTLIDVQGFGPFRPAHLADPNNPAFAIGEALALKKLDVAKASGGEQQLEKPLSNKNNDDDNKVRANNAPISSQQSINQSEETVKPHDNGNYVLLDRRELQDALESAYASREDTSSVSVSDTEKSEKRIKAAGNDDAGSNNDSYIVDRNGNLYSQFKSASPPTIEEQRALELKRELYKGKKEALTIEEQKELLLPKKYVSSSR
jgi:hypothetical protein